MIACGADRAILAIAWKSRSVGKHAIIVVIIIAQHGILLQRKVYAIRRDAERFARFLSLLP
jgi:hypothetical protein